MKCDELKSLWVYSRDINENCDEEFVNFAKENGYEELVEKKEVTEAIAELKARIQLDDDEMEGFLQLEEECGGGDLRNYIAEKDKEIESLKASHYAEMVDTGMRERRLRRALWLARALRARDKAFEYHFKNNVEMCAKWDNVHLMLMAKAEEYK